MDDGHFCQVCSAIVSNELQLAEPHVAEGTDHWYGKSIKDVTSKGAGHHLPACNISHDSLETILLVNRVENFFQLISETSDSLSSFVHSLGKKQHR